jgi:hypothetical protein
MANKAVFTHDPRARDNLLDIKKTSSKGSISFLASERGRKSAFLLFVLLSTPHIPRVLHAPAAGIRQEQPYLNSAKSNINEPASSPLF